MLARQAFLPLEPLCQPQSFLRCKKLCFSADWNDPVSKRKSCWNAVLQQVRRWSEASDRSKQGVFPKAGGKA
jgi:hypothetical protein